MYMLDQQALPNYQMGRFGWLAYRTHAAPVYASSTSVSNTIPSATRKGDLIILVCMHRSSVPTAPSGFKLSCQEKENNLNQYVQLYSKTASASDAGATVTLTQSTSARCAIGIIVITSTTGGAQLETTNMVKALTAPAVTSQGAGRLAVVASTNVYTTDATVFTITGTGWQPCNPQTAVVDQRLAVSVLSMDAGTMPSPTIYVASDISAATVSAIYRAA